jgi:hypothetical protein
MEQENREEYLLGERMTITGKTSSSKAFLNPNIDCMVVVPTQAGNYHQ